MLCCSQAWGSWVEKGPGCWNFGVLGLGSLAQQGENMGMLLSCSLRGRGHENRWNLSLFFTSPTAKAENCSPGQAAPSSGQLEQQVPGQWSWSQGSVPGMSLRAVSQGCHPAQLHAPALGSHRVPCSVRLHQPHLHHPPAGDTQDPKHLRAGDTEVSQASLHTSGYLPRPWHGDRLGHLHHATPHPASPPNSTSTDERSAQLSAASEGGGFLAVFLEQSAAKPSKPPSQREFTAVPCGVTRH